MWTKNLPVPSIPSLSREKKKSSEFVYIPEMPGYIGRIACQCPEHQTVVLQEKSSGGLFLCEFSSFVRRQGGPPPRKTWTSLVRQGRVGPALQRTNGRPAAWPPRGPGSGLRTRLVGVGRRGRSLSGTWPGGARDGRDQLGSHPRMCIRSLVSPHLSPFLKVKAVIYSPSRFSECSLNELDSTFRHRGRGQGSARWRGHDRGRQSPRDPLRPWTWLTPDSATRSSDSKAQICPPA